MSKYTLRGSKELDARIDADMERIAHTASPYCKTGILLGGYGRGEGTPFINSDGSQAPFNDYDLVVVVDKITPQILQKFRSLEEQLTRETDLTVDLCPYSASYIPKCEKSLFNYEMKHGHKVIWGDPTILDAMPDFKVPVSEGSRLLLNRGKLLLDIKRRLTSAEPLSEEEQIRFIKFIHKVRLAFGDCALLAAGKYDIFYAVKKTRISDIGNGPDRNTVIEHYLNAVELKEWGDFRALEYFDITEQFKETAALFLKFMPWYRNQCSSRECPLPKAVALNLKWNKNLCTQHPRIKLYDAICELLQDRSAMSHERFYKLQRRFS